MPRHANGFDAAQLEQFVMRLQDMVRERERLAKQLADLDEKLGRLGGGFVGNGRRGPKPGRPRGRRRGGPRRGVGSRVRNEVGLNDTIEKILRDHGKPMRVGDIADAAMRSGYKTNSANFRSIVNQALIKDKRFDSAARGLYQLKK